MICKRCGQITDVHIMSMFNTDEICLECKDKEVQHPQYNIALLTEIAEIENGNYNFQGIGWEGN